VPVEVARRGVHLEIRVPAPPGLEILPGPAGRFRTLVPEFDAVFGARGPYARLVATLDADVRARLTALLLGDPSPSVRVLAALVLGAPVAVADLEPAFLVDPDGLPPRLARLGEDALLALLADGGAAVAHALGIAGTSRAVQPLIDAGHPEDARAVQARLTGERGRLAVVAEGGEVSLATEAGAPSLEQRNPRSTKFCPPPLAPHG
jgi:hypothetical protein